MSSSPSVAKAAAISSPLLSPSGAAKFAFVFPATSKSAPLGSSVTASRPCHQLESDDVWAKFLDGLHRKVRRRPVEDCHSAAVSDRHILRDDAIPSRPAGVDPIRHFFLLKDAQVHVGLGNPP